MEDLKARLYDEKKIIKEILKVLVATRGGGRDGGRGREGEGGGRERGRKGGRELVLKGSWNSRPLFANSKHRTGFKPAS